MKILKIYLPIVSAMTCWALSFVWIKDAYSDFSPLSLVVTRLIGASILLLVIGTLTKKMQAIKQGDLKLFIGIAFFEPFLYFLGESFGMQQVSSTLGAVIISTIPLFTPLISYFMIKEKITIPNIVGIFISLAGVLIIVLRNDGSMTAPLSGILMLFVAVFAAIFYPVFLKPLAHRYTGTTIVAYQSIFGLIFFLPLFFIFEYSSFITTSFSSKSLIAAAELTVFASVFAFLFFTASVKNIGVMKSNTFVNLIPAFTAVFAFFILGESLTITKAMGIVIVITGLFVSQLKFKKKAYAI